MKPWEGWTCKESYPWTNRFVCLLDNTMHNLHLEVRFPAVCKWHDRILEDGFPEGDE